MSATPWYKNLLGKPPRASRSQVRNLNAWLENHTFHHSRFSDLKYWVSRKEAQKLTISVCLPTLNEEKTIGKEIVLLRSELMTRHPLIDEIAVIDSGSTDRTREVAASFGAQVHLASDILTQYGSKKGKGENLWKAIYQLKGDIIVYIDADITNIRPHFAYGLVGPLLENPEVKYVKAFYERPLTLDKGPRTSGGGRVTEILVRPLFSLYYPELTALIQPLSGEYAARREALENIPFPIGYGVETSHLLDIYHRWGLGAFAQVDLDCRVHRNQSTHALGRMSFGIMQTFFRRLEQYAHLRRALPSNTLLRQFKNENGRYSQVESEILEEERPPMISLPEYQQKFDRRP